MEVLRAILACIMGRRGRGDAFAEDAYGEVIYDEKTAALYSDDEPYTQHDIMSYYTQPPSYYHGGRDNHDNYDNHSNSSHDDGGDDNERPADTRTVEEIAREVARLLWRAEWNDDALQSRISDAVGEERRWNRRMVEACLDRVIEHVEAGRGGGMGGAMCAALDRATDVADDEFTFPRHHPASLDGFIAIVSVGVLAELQGAWVLELLGFGEVRGKEALGGGDGSREIAMLTSDKITFAAQFKPGSVAAWWAREYAAYIPTGSVYEYLRRMDMIELDD